MPMFIAMGLHLGEEIPEQIGIPPYSDGGEIEAGGAGSASIISGRSRTTRASAMR
ncbi:hypothetical protein [Candidatus Methanomethylophilus sp. 1R26]|uniref:hypothetical protein n=1 Tax=Candidatus Methanomethylophilus sp. 1R26 TaxID=1769296 RepID=UPI002A4E282A|nr:hypothetical protein [Candidatus Methanomethylophilus sp. 1R26]